jgi:hypothetical protein
VRTTAQTFESIFPGAYPGRWPHIHFEVFPSLAAATGSDALLTSQIALPQVACTGAYTAAGYEDSAGAFAGTSIGRDNVFRDDEGITQMATYTGTVETGFRISLDVAV